MAHEETVILDKLIEDRKVITVLEWGGGGSTIYFPKTHPRIRVWDTIEHDKEWYWGLLARKDLPKSVGLNYQPGKDYFNAPKIFKYDLIIVDGRDNEGDRVECLKRAGEFLAKGGIVILHDSGRLKYRKGYKYFNHYEELAPGVGHGKDGGADFRGLTMFYNEK